MQHSSTVTVLALTVFLVGALMVAGCTSPTASSPPTVSPPASQPAPATPAAQVSQAAPPPASPAAGDQDSQFIQAITSSTQALAPLLDKVGSDASSMNTASLKTSAAAMSAQAAADYATISGIQVSDTFQSIKTNYLNALKSFQEAGDKMEKGIKAAESGDTQTATQLLNESTNALSAGNGYLQQVMASAKSP